MTSLKNEIIREVTCRPEGEWVAIPVLVEDYGVEVKTAILELAREGTVRLLGHGGVLTWTARECGMDVDVFEAGCIRGVGDLFVGVELAREQVFDF